jgi:hypothetical protein
MALTLPLTAADLTDGFDRVVVFRRPHAIERDGRRRGADRAARGAPLHARRRPRATGDADQQHRERAVRIPAAGRRRGALRDRAQRQRKRARHRRPRPGDGARRDGQAAALRARRRCRRPRAGPGGGDERRAVAVHAWLLPRADDRAAPLVGADRRGARALPRPCPRARAAAARAHRPRALRRAPGDLGHGVAGCQRSQRSDRARGSHRSWFRGGRRSSRARRPCPGSAVQTTRTRTSWACSRAAPRAASCGPARSTDRRSSGTS